MDINDKPPERTDWVSKSRNLVSELKDKNIKKIALVGIRDYTFETFLSETFLNAGIATITPEFKARTEIEECTSAENLQSILTKYSKLGAQAIICENLIVHDAACRCGICVQRINMKK